VVFAFAGGGLAVPRTEAAPVALARGMVVALAGTPHIWIADDQGVLHWNGDTRALTTRFVDCGNRESLSLAQLQGLPRGEPWLSAGLVKDGDPIYLAKWESDAAQPTLLHIQSIADVELFGITASNYGALVVERGSWEQKFGLQVGALAHGELSGAASAAQVPLSGRVGVSPAAGSSGGSPAKASSGGLTR
jgi:hypothetical protein